VEAPPPTDAQTGMPNQRLNLTVWDQDDVKHRLTTYQGKVAELRAELTGTGKKDKNHVAKKNALKKIVANMTMSNNDMIALFPDIVACMEIPVLEIKKMSVLQRPPLDER
jgi:hypothetical protein